MEYKIFLVLYWRNHIIRLLLTHCCTVEYKKCIHEYIKSDYCHNISKHFCHINFDISSLLASYFMIDQQAL